MEKVKSVLNLKSYILFMGIGMFSWGIAHAQTTTLVDLDFNSGVDSFGNSQGTLEFNGIGEFQVSFTDDESNGNLGGNAEGVHITDENYGNRKVGTTDLVLGSYSDYRGNRNYHSSGIVAEFNYGVSLVRLLDTDNDWTTKTLFAFDEQGNLIGQTQASSRIVFQIDTSMTGGKLIHKVEFDTHPGTRGGSYDGTYFTIDNFYVEGAPQIQSSCQLYGVDDKKLNDSQFFTISPETFEIKKLGDVKVGLDIEALDVHPQTGVLFAASGKDTDKPGYLYTVDKITGELTVVGNTEFREIDGLSFAPDGTLWGWATGDGLIRIDLPSVDSTLIVDYQGEMEDLTWNIAGDVLYIVGNLSHSPDTGTELLAYDTSRGTLNTICQQQTQQREIEALDALPDDSLIFGIHGESELLLGAINPETCQITASKNISTDDYHDVEGITWLECR